MQKILFMLYLTLSVVSLNVYAEKPTSYGPVTKGKTLWEIAIALRPDETVDPYQVAIALMKANPDAFNNRCNYNTLKLNETLHLPPLDQVKAIPVQEATSEFKRQGTQWKNRKTDKITCSDLLDAPLAVAEVKPPVAEAKPQEAPAPATPAAPAAMPTPPAPPIAPIPAPQPVADVKPAEPPKPAPAVPAEFTKLMGIMLGLFGVMLLIAFIYDRFIDTE
jgi:FimV-like protein